MEKQDSTPVGCVPPACQPYVFRWPPLGVSTGGGPQVPCLGRRREGVGSLFPCPGGEVATQVSFPRGGGYSIM